MHSIRNSLEFLIYLNADFIKYSIERRPEKVFKIKTVKISYSSLTRSLKWNSYF